MYILHKQTLYYSAQLTEVCTGFVSRLLESYNPTVYDGIHIYSSTSSGCSIAGGMMLLLGQKGIQSAHYYLNKENSRQSCPSGIRLHYDIIVDDLIDSGFTIVKMLEEFENLCPNLILIGCHFNAGCREIYPEKLTSLLDKVVEVFPIYLPEDSILG